MKLFLLLLKYAWPFIEEIFFKNKDIKDNLKSPQKWTKVIFIVLLMGSLVWGLKDLFNTYFIESQEKYRENVAVLNRALEEQTRLHREIQATELELSRTITASEILNRRIVELEGFLNYCTAYSEEIEGELAAEKVRCKQLLETPSLIESSPGINVNELLQGLE